MPLGLMKRLLNWSAPVDYSTLSNFSHGDRLEDRFIRLIKLEPGKTAQVVTCKTEIHSIDSLVKFETLSYVWGDPNITETIICDGQLLQVTKNLHDALIQLRAFDGIRAGSPIWIDAICINQKDEVEKTRQVRMMGEIYSKSSLVYIWLGTQFDGAEDSLRGLQLILSIDKAIISNEFESKEELSLVVYQLFKEFIKANGLDEFMTWMEVWRIFMKGWFRRIWVVQESLLSPANRVLCGPCITEISILFRVASALTPARSLGMAMAPFATGIDTPIPAKLSAPGFAEISFRYEASKDIKLHELVHETFAFDSTDPRDRIFALVGLASDVEPRTFIDYALDARTVHINLAKNALNAYKLGDWGFLNFLTFVRPYKVDSKLELPSWAPDLTHFDLTWGGHFEPLANLFPRSKVEDSHPLPVHVVFGDDESLQLHGIVLDSISSIIQRYPYSLPISNMSLNPESYQELAHALVDWQLEAAKFAKGLTKYSDAAYACTLAFNPFTDNSDPQSFHQILSQYNTFCQMIELIPKQHKAYVESVRTGVDAPDYDQTKAQLDEAAFACKDFASNFDKFSKCRYFSSTADGRMAWVPMTAEPGDYIVALKPSQIPFVVRKTGRGYRILGDCFLQGEMNEESFRKLAESSEEFMII